MSQTLTDPLPFLTFGAALKFLRKRVRLTQDELGRAVGYGREQIARLENDSRLPDLTVLAALFIPALELQREPQLVARLMEMAAAARQAGDPKAEAVRITVTHATHQRVEVSQTILEPILPAALPSMVVHRPPSPLLPLIGRQEAVARACALLRDDARLLTVIGPPGVGKTRLALEVGRQLAADFAHGAGWVALAPIQSGDDFAAAVATALSIFVGAGQTPDGAVRAYLATHPLLLILDNCEHLLPAMPCISAWLQAAPQLRILCTSRVPLDLYGEYELTVPPLALPDLARLPPPAELAQVHAVKLFVDRTIAVDTNFHVDGENALAVAALCIALDGLPLAIELAAARSRTHSPQELLHAIVAARQHHRPTGALLAQSRRGVEERHRTLQEAIDWSYRLLAPAAQRTFAQLGVFVGGCTLAAAQAVCEGADRNVHALVQANLVQFETGNNGDAPAQAEAPTEARLLLLETLRTFAADQLAAQGELAAAQARHAAYCAAYAQEIFAGLLGEEQALWMQRARREHDNLQAALRFALQHADGETAVAISAGLWWFWNRQGLLREGSAWLDASLNCPTQGSPPDLLYQKQRARALNGAGSLATELGNLADGLRYHREGLALRQALDDQAGVADILHNMALTARCQGDFTQALRWFEDSLAITVAMGHAAESDVMNYANIGITHFELDEPAAAQPWLETALATARSQHDRWRSAYIAGYLAHVLLAQGDLPRAGQLAQESVQEFERLGDHLFLAESLLVLARTAIHGGDRRQAAEFCRTALDIYRSIDDRHGIANTLLVEAWLALADQEQPQGRVQAGALVEQAYTLRVGVPRTLTPYEEAEYGKLRRAVCTAEAIDLPSYGTDHGPNGIAP